MPLALVSDLSRNLLVRTFAATAAVFLFLALATGALPLNCLAGAQSCAAKAAVEVTTILPDPAMLPSAEPAAQVAVAEAAAPAGPTLTQNEVVAGSFALLTAGFTAPVASTDLPNADDDMAAPKVRTVKTVTIRADGTPELAAGADAGGAVETPVAMVTPVPPLVAPSPSTDTMSLPTSAEPVVDAAPVVEQVATAEPTKATPPRAAPAPAPKKSSVRTTGHSGTLKGQGANVHSDAKSTSGVLFALAGGSKVSVLGTSHGWVHVTDARGRSGWIYKDYLAL